MRLSLVWPCLFALVSASPLEATATITDPPAAIQERAVRPTTKGMIGIDPWKNVQKDPDVPSRPVIHDYTAHHGKPDNIVETKTMTENGKTMTTTVSAPIAIKSGEKSDVIVVMGEKLRTTLVEIANKVTPCSAKKRNGPASCGVRDFISLLKKSDDEGVRQVVNMVEYTIEGMRNLAEWLQIDQVTLQGAGITTVGIGLLVAVYETFGSNIPLSFSADNNSDKGSLKGLPSMDNSQLDDNNKGSSKGNSAKEGQSVAVPVSAEVCPHRAPTGPRAPMCRKCGGSSKHKTCTTGPWAGCDCALDPIGISIQQPSPGWDLQISTVWEDATSSKGQLLEKQKPVVNCSSHYGDAVSVEKNFLEKLAEKFCSGDKHEAVLTRLDIKSQQYPGVQVAFKYEPGEGCQATCKQGFKLLFPECAGVNSHVMQPKGKAAVHECKASYEYEVTESTKPKCDVGIASKTPANAFQKAPVWGKFCEHLDNSNDSRHMVVDINGFEVPQPKRDLEARTPPANLKDYSDKRITLSWKPNHQGIRSRSCSDAFHDMTQSQCGRAGSQQNMMAQAGSVFVGDGTYRYHIQMNDVLLAEGRKECFELWYFDAKSKFTIGDAIKLKRYADPTWKACGAGLGDMAITPKHHQRTDEMGYTDPSGRFGFYIYWRRGCKLRDGPQLQRMDDPLGDGSVSCPEAYRQAAATCDSGDDLKKGEHNDDLKRKSAGGYKDFGCLRYMITPVGHGWHFLTNEDME